MKNMLKLSLLLIFLGSTAYIECAISGITTKTSAKSASRASVLQKRCTNICTNSKLTANFDEKANLCSCLDNKNNAVKIISFGNK